MDNDFRSLDLSPPFVTFGRVYRKLSWSHRMKRNGQLVGRPADPNLNEIQCGRYVVRHPLKVDGVVYGFPRYFYVSWGADGCFRGVRDYFGISFEHLLILIDYAEKYMGLHNFDFWKVVNNG